MRDANPDLNPIEHMWFWMKHKIETHYDIQRLSLPELRAAVLATWEAVPAGYLRSLAHSMPRKVLEKGGDVTGY